uniref:Uncharacterized protein n=1 Tax=Rhizophora mucronata TaxID=61149 RepID=A0A2P2R0U6_RHIMU
MRNGRRTLIKETKTLCQAEFLSQVQENSAKENGEETRKGSSFSG